MRRLTWWAATAAVAVVSTACATSYGIAPPSTASAVPTPAGPPPRTSASIVPSAVSIPSTIPPSTIPPSNSSTPSTVPPASIDESPFLRETRANEAGAIMVLQYHLIEEPEGRWARTPTNLRQDIDRLIAGGYYPVTVADLGNGHIDVPAGKTPVVLTFDDSSSGQCRYRPDGTPDPDSACGILLDAARRHPADWAPIATFFVLLDVDVPDRIVFGQPEWSDRKLTDMVSWGMEIASHTISHFAMDSGTPEQIRWQLAVPERTIESIIPGYELESLSLPFGIYPADDSLLASGEFEGDTYDHIAAVEVSGGPSPSPHVTEFRALHILRIQAVQSEVDGWLSYFASNPTERYVSDGDPLFVSVPDPLPSGLRHHRMADLPEGMMLRRYDAG